MYTLVLRGVEVDLVLKGGSLEVQVWMRVSVLELEIRNWRLKRELGLVRRRSNEFDRLQLSVLGAGNETEMANLFGTFVQGALIFLSFTDA